MAYGYTHLPKNMADEGGPTSLHDQVGMKSGGRDYSTIAPATGQKPQQYLCQIDCEETL